MRRFRYLRDHFHSTTRHSRRCRFPRDHLNSSTPLRRFRYLRDHFHSTPMRRSRFPRDHSMRLRRSLRFLRDHLHSTRLRRFRFLRNRFHPTLMRRFRFLRDHFHWSMRHSRRCRFLRDHLHWSTRHSRRCRFLRDRFHPTLMRRFRFLRGRLTTRSSKLGLPESADRQRAPSYSTSQQPRSQRRMPLARSKQLGAATSTCRNYDLRSFLSGSPHVQGRASVPDSPPHRHAPSSSPLWFAEAHRSAAESGISTHPQPDVKCDNEATVQAHLDWRRFRNRKPQIARVRINRI
jgi:hypothetical protein